MTLTLALLGLILKIIGFLFLLAAAIGLLRFADPLQRMHASTKAGTVGAGFIVGGAALASGSLTAMVIGAMTILFLIFTVPIAGHLLGRAIYLAGTPLQGLAERNDLHSVQMPQHNQQIQKNRYK